MKILIAEDDAFHRKFLAGILAAWPEHELTFADDGLAAWTLLADLQIPFDLVFLDVNLPKLGGLELLQRLRESAKRRSVKFVMCSSDNDRATISKAILMGAKRYIVKPYGAAIIAETLRQIGATSTAPVPRTETPEQATVTASA